MCSRNLLKFPDAAVDAFSFLQDHGFSVVETDETHVVFAGETSSIRIYHGRKSFEIGLEWQCGEEVYYLSELIRLTGEKSFTPERNFVATTPEAVRKGVAQLSSVFRQHALPALGNLSESLDKLRNQRRQWSTHYALEVLAEQTRPLANAAFHEGHYARAAQLYESIEDALTTAEKHKLLYAKANHDEPGKV